ncbi:hypothetical protein [Limosilactobacillus equigenerosi]|uniref:DUF2187 domain-containing protein n=1 Tax=Limosilactobacillus equigenerosi DSM 18793 = JCM 14505 TaxID=1423742 RepID=A0A0R1UN46_9LACO|nr:hypothetical protein [Limosilactobacillus equigenerosi]KRL94678.1 hypothetical protein FC21_GL001295 [Limosilactobacillus equigenerosi DSM 18793 = JCM 14505]
MTYFKVGDYVQGPKLGPLEHEFAGEVEKVYTNSILVAIKEFDSSDQSGVNELNNRAVISKGDAKLVKAVPRTEEDEALAAEEEKAQAAKEAKANKNKSKKTSDK